MLICFRVFFDCLVLSLFFTDLSVFVEHFERKKLETSGWSAAPELVFMVNNTANFREAWRSSEKLGNRLDSRWGRSED